MQQKFIFLGLGLVIGAAISGFVVSQRSDEMQESSKTAVSQMSSGTTNHDMNEMKKNDGMSMNAMVTSLQGKTGDDFDALFIAEMIEHHQGAIDMARLATSSAKHDEVKSLAKDVITAQTKEIEAMKSWQQKWGY